MQKLVVGRDKNNVEEWFLLTNSNELDSNRLFFGNSKEDVIEQCSRYYDDLTLKIRSEPSGENKLYYGKLLYGNTVILEVLAGKIKRGMIRP